MYVMLCVPVPATAASKVPAVPLVIPVPLNTPVPGTAFVTAGPFSVSVVPVLSHIPGTIAGAASNGVVLKVTVSVFSLLQPLVYAAVSFIVYVPCT